MEHREPTSGLVSTRNKTKQNQSGSPSSSNCLVLILPQYGVRKKEASLTKAGTIIKISIVGSALGFVNFRPLGLDKDYCASYRIPMNQASNPSRKWLVSKPIIVMPLLHQWAWLVWQVGVASCMVPSGQDH